MLHSAASDQGPHCLPITLLGVSRLKWVNIFVTEIFPSEIIPLSVAQDKTRRGRQHSFVAIDHEIFSTVILSLPLIQEGQLSVSGERMCTILVNGLED